jgi:hypothetical protein
VIVATIWLYIYYLFLVVCCGCAILRGSRAEYSGAAIMIIGSLSTLAVGRLFGTSWTSVEGGIFAIDLAGLVALIYVALAFDRFWPIWAAAFHLLAVSIHTAMLVAPQVTPWAFATGAVFWAYPMLLALAIGSYEHAPSPIDQENDSG